MLRPPPQELKVAVFNGPGLCKIIATDHSTSLKIEFVSEDVVCDGDGGRKGVIDVDTSGIGRWSQRCR